MKEKLNEIILSEIEAEFQMYSDKEFTTKLQRRGLVADIVEL